jgi:2-aminomuconate deaminase
MCRCGAEASRGRAGKARIGRRKSELATPPNQHDNLLRPFTPYQNTAPSLRPAVQLLAIHPKSTNMSAPSPNGAGYLLPATGAQGLANYPHARTIPSTARTIFVSGTSSRRGDGTYEGCTTREDGFHELDCGAQTAAVLRNIETIIRGATDGQRGLESVVDATVFLTDIRADYAKMNAEWNKVWPDRTKAPARTCVQVAALPNERLNVEIKCQAIVD